MDQELTFDTKTNSENIKELTLQEKKVLELVAQQKSSNEIADLLFISIRTVEGHRSKIIEKLDLPKKKHSLLLWAMEHFKK